MTQPRSALISIADTPWYHVVSRCVRRAFLCGEDRLTGKSFEHRRGWIETWILQLANLFAIDVAAYAVMSNHYHIVVRIDVERAAGWSLEGVLARWTELFTGPLLVQRYLSMERDQMTEAELDKVRALAEGYRERLTSLSWFMRVLNENIAREANREEGVKGRFWEGRFKSQALLDEVAVLSAMAYVDLNPIRAGLARTPEQSDHTSIQARIEALVADDTCEEDSESATLSAGSMATTPPAVAVEPPLPVGLADQITEPQKTVDLVEALCPLKETSTFNGLPRAALLPFGAAGQCEQAIPFAYNEYVELVDTVGRAIRPDKRGAIPLEAPRILVRLGLNTEAFMAHASRMLKEFGHAVGRPEQLVALAEKRQAKSLRGITTARALCGRQAA
jgi:REP element-mobilizing transposase RayT